MSTWILISNASEAHLYEATDHLFSPMRKKHERPELLQSFYHEESRRKDENLVSDNLGRFHHIIAGHGNFIEPTDPKEAEAEIFARELAELLEEGRVDQKYEQIILAAPPHFHGLINKHLNKNVNRLIQTHIEKDYTKDKIDDLIKHLEQFF